MISHFELKQLRSHLGITKKKMGELLGLQGSTVEKTMRDMESGKKTISGPIQRLVKYMQQGFITATMEKVFPRFIFGDAGPAEITQIEMDGIAFEPDFLHHTQYPRFTAAILPFKITGLDSIKIDEIEVLNIIMWIDEPVDEKQANETLESAALACNEYNELLNSN